MDAPASAVSMPPPAPTPAPASAACGPYVAEFLGTLIFLGAILLVVTKVAAPVCWVALLIALGLFLGLWASMSLGGPGYLNPAVAVMLGAKDRKGTNYVVGMILAECAAILAALLVYYALLKKGDGRVFAKGESPLGGPF